MCCGKQYAKFKTGTKFSEIKQKIRPLDIIVFRGSELVSDTISIVEQIFLGNGEWTHIGIVITPELVNFKNGVAGKLYVWESTMSGKLTDGVMDVETGNFDFGVQIRDLEELIDKFDMPVDSRIGWCQLLKNPLDKKDDETSDEYILRLQQIKDILQKFYIDHGEDLYDFNFMSLLKTVLSKMPKCCGSKHMLFCSEMVTIIYQMLNIVDKNIDPETIAPVELIDGLNPIVNQPVIITREWKKV